MEFCAALKSLLGEHGVLTAPEDRAPYERDWRGLVENPAIAVALPKTTAQVSEIVKLCEAHGIAIVPQGGNTGLVAGAVPVSGQPQIILAFHRMNEIQNIDIAGENITVQAGVTLAAVQQAAQDAGKIFPISFAAEGSAQIGGVISTNAGGVQVLSYGNMRAQVLGLEAVLAGGKIWNGLQALPKDNTGYDLKQLFIGAEGTLGIITSACLRLYPAPKLHATALVGIEAAKQAVELFQSVRQAAGHSLIMCEYMDESALALGGTPPFAAPAYLLLSIAGLTDQANPQNLLESLLAEALESGLARNAVIAQSGRERQNLLTLREKIPEGELEAGGAIKHDIAVPLCAMAEMVEATRSWAGEKFPACRLNIFGHLGDGNLHINVRPPAGKTLADLATQKPAITSAIESLAVSRGGSFSAEHGIGQLRLPGMAAHKSPIALDLMRSLKHAFDPAGIFNPGKLIPPEPK